MTSLDEQLSAFAHRIVASGRPMTGVFYLPYGDRHEAHGPLPHVYLSEHGEGYEARAVWADKIAVTHGESVEEALSKMEAELMRNPPDPSSPPEAPSE